MDQFDAFFRRADLDHDGRISGAEAVAFFQGSNLPKPVLAQIWQHADQNRTGFLGRQEFCNALKLVTVAQSKRELTPDIVKAALYGPASAKIPPPQINLSALPPTPPQRPPTQNPGITNSIPPSNPGIPSSIPPQNPGIPNSIPPQTFSVRGQVPPNSIPSVAPPSSVQYFATQNQPVRPTPGGLPGLAGPTVPAPRPSLGSGNASDAMFGGDVFSVSKSLSKPFPTTQSEPQVKVDPLGSLTAFTRQPTVSQPGPTQNSSFGSSGFSVEVKTQAPNVVQPQWPKMTQAGVNKYMKVFIKVDDDRDGKITGEQARNLFTSWKLPREILKQVWDLSDQDNDSMLSLREFCIALYLMERYREGHNLPPTLPTNVLLDETLLSLTGPPNPSFRPPNWGPNSGPPPQQVVPGGQPIPHAGMRPPMPGPQPTPHQQRGPQPPIDSSHPHHHTNGDQNNNSISRETNEPNEDKKVILDSREKMTFFRNKMQDLVLYKSRCDNRLNEITERALADKRESELLAKKYEEKYKLVAEVASKLTIEEASFRDIQERKMELNQALVKMEQGGSADGILQVRADRIQSDLEELLKALSERCKKHGITVKSTAIIELPQGWQPGVPEISAVWDEDWDKFEDEGFSFDGVGTANPKSENPSSNENFDSYSNADVESEKPFETESAFEDESAKSPAGSPTAQKIFESPTKEDSFSHFGKSFDNDTETNSGFDDQGWGTFDNNDDVDSVWGFNSEATKEPEHGENYFFDSNSFTASPRTDSPHANTFFQKKSPFGFDDSVPGSPASRAGTSPRYSGGGGAENSFFDNFSRYDSFAASDRGSQTLSRFDSMSSTTQDHNSFAGGAQDRSFARFDSMSSNAAYSFDESDPFGSSGPFKVSESHTGKSENDKWAF